MSGNDSIQATEQLKQEVTLLAGLQHVNLVRLIGYCIQENEKLLVYEYMVNGSLETYLGKNNLIYNKRCKNYNTYSVVKI